MRSTSSAATAPEGIERVRPRDPFGPLTQDPRVPSWFISRPEGVPYFDGVVLPFVFVGLAHDPIPEELGAAARAFLALGTSDRELATPFVQKHLADSASAVGPEDLAELGLAVEPGDDVWRHVHPREVVVSRRARDGRVYVRSMAECAWDPEHGLQVVPREGRVLSRVSSQDGHVTHADAYGLPEARDRIV